MLHSVTNTHNQNKSQHSLTTMLLATSLIAIMSLKPASTSELLEVPVMEDQNNQIGEVFDNLMVEMFDTEQSYAQDVEAKFTLEQTVKVYKTRLDYYFDLFDRFLEGGRATVFSPNAMKCSQRIRTTALDFNSTFMNYKASKGKNLSYDRYVFNFTSVVSNSGAESVGECYTTAFNLYSYVMMRKSQFKDITSIMTAFLQNLIGNILNFNTIYQNIVNANNAAKLSDVYFYIGRLTYIIIYFDPIDYAPLQTANDLKTMSAVEFLLKQSTNINNQASVGVISKISDVALSFLNSSIGVVSPNSTICLSNLTALNTTITTLNTQYKMKVYDKMGPTLRAITKSFDPITRSCYYSLFEYGKVVWTYLLTMTDINKLSYNFIHNLGRIYDATTDLIDNFRYGDPKVRRYWRRIGGDIGLVINQLAYLPTNYDPYKPQNTTKPKVLTAHTVIN
ncbi:hypothetical protein FGO68_gene338 [Halteria grandinella]|uniref:Uncharacterized protein n=1 Tax=Halteria grandinella TaxID=5974 RepID=A0A8J8NDQ0_HALGN|nr:hypothetical protein FGO68_gene338 [Halteria grandinella]